MIHFQVLAYNQPVLRLIQNLSQNREKFQDTRAKLMRRRM